MLVGKYEDFKLSEIKERAHDLRKMIFLGQDPMEEQAKEIKQKLQEQEEQKPVDEVFAEYHEKYSKVYKKPSTQRSDINEYNYYLKEYVEPLHQESMFAEKSWGSYSVLDVTDEGMTIKVFLKAGNHMNYHSHEKRDEIWNVICGTGKTVVDGMEQPVKTGDVITMSAGCKHTVIAESELQLIEVQLGTDISVADKKKYELN